jgi:amidase
VSFIEAGNLKKRLKKMNLMGYSQYDGLGLGELIKKGEVTAKELAQLMIAGVEKVNPQINAIIQVYEDQIEHLEKNNNKNNGPFAGVPFLRKDLGASEAGRLKESGSRLAAGFIPEHDSFLTSYFKDAGLVFMGRSTTPEMGFSSSTESVLHGATRNPWDLNLSAGGSSGGAAAAVAAGIVPVAHASDGAGSIRIPASWCGLVGLKPSRGRVSKGPDAAESLQGMASEFIVSKTVRDSAAMLDAVGKPAPGDPFVIRQPAKTYMEAIKLKPEKLKIAWTLEPWGPFMVAEEVSEKLLELVKILERMGHQVIEDTPVFDYEEHQDAQLTGWAFGFDVSMDNLAKTMGREVSLDTLEPITYSVYEHGKRLTTADIISMNEVFNKIRRIFGKFFSKYDLMLTPTLTDLPVPIGELSQNISGIDFKEFFRRCDETGMYLPLFNLTGQPAITLPIFESKVGLPIGMQFVSHFGGEELLFSLSSVLEKTIPWHERKPPIHVSNI